MKTYYKLLNFSVIFFLSVQVLSANWIMNNKDDVKKHGSFDMHEKYQKEMNETDSLPSGVTKEWLNSLTDETGQKIIRSEDPEGDALQERFFTGYAAGDYFGTSVSSAGDMNGDGFDDVIIGAHLNDAGGSNAGRAYIYFGGSIINSGVDVILTGAAAGDQFGFSVSTAGDVNGDGFSDVIVGAGYNDAGGTDAGRAYIFFGGNTVNSGADVIFTGETALDIFGYSVSSAGDVNGDGYSDIIAGAYLNDAGGFNAGKVYVYFGGSSMNNAADLILTGKAPGDFFGNSVSSSGDVNADGFSDIIAGAPFNDAGGNDAGRAYVYFGGNLMDSTADVILTGASAGDQFGLSVSSAEDVNNDGYCDIIAGAPYNDAGGADAGRAYVYYGGSVLDNTADVILTAAAPNDGFGYSVSKAEDVNGDGFSDIMVGAPYNDAGGADAGRTYVYFGESVPDNTADVIITGVAAGDNSGFSVSSAGDMNGDCYSEVIVGAYANDAGGSNAGRTYVYLNSMTGPDIADEYFTGATAGDLFGFSVSSIGDVNGDGFNDIIIGALYNDANGSNAGRAYIFFGGNITNNTADIILSGTNPDDLFGISVSSAGDVNGDGFSDVIVGANGNDVFVTADNAGRAYIFLGGSTMDTAADVTVNGSTAGDNFGISVSSAGDVNGDGFSDVIVGASYNDAWDVEAGRAYIYFGGSLMNSVSDVTLTGASAYDFFGGSVSSAGDVNRDGFSDVIVGADRNDAGGADAGRAYIFFGNSVMNNTADVILTGETTGDFFGFSVSSAGDVNSDGFSDVIAGAYANDFAGNLAGRAYIYFGGNIMNNTSDVILTGEAANEFFGRSVSSAGDVNGDGYSDVITGAINSNANTGRTYVFFGGSTMDNIADLLMTAEAVADEMGSSVSTAGDMNGDGYSDVLAGASRNDAGGSNAGRAYLYLSSSPSVKPILMSSKDVPFDQGGIVNLRWVRSGYDVQGQDIITGYLIERSLPPGIHGFAWNTVNTIPATKNPQYFYPAPTLNDSMSGNSGTTFYRITAQTSDVNQFWRSNILSGYSIDNLAPFAPGNLSAAPMVSDVSLDWDQNLETDLHHYLIYRNGVQIASSLNSNYIDSTATEDSTYNYNTAAVDIHGNISSLSNTSVITVNHFGNINLTLIMEGFYDASLNNMRLADTVSIYLRNSDSPYLIADSSRVVINATTFTGSFNNVNAPSGNYYIAVKHRNTIETWSSSPVSYTSGGVVNYNFISAISQAYGSNMKQVDASPVRFGIFSGDVNQDALVDLNDLLLVYNAASSFSAGYIITDLTGDYLADLNDLILTYNNSTGFVNVVDP